MALQPHDQIQKLSPLTEDDLDLLAVAEHMVAPLVADNAIDLHHQFEGLIDMILVQPAGIERHAPDVEEHIKSYICRFVSLYV